MSSFIPLRNIISKVARWVGGISPTSPWRSSSRGERIIASGVLNSWVMLAKNWDLKRSSCLSCSWAAFRFAVVRSMVTWLAMVSRWVRKSSIWPVPAMIAVEMRNARLENSVSTGPAAPAIRFGITKEAMIEAWVNSTTWAGQTKSNPVATIASDSPA